ncbi:uncharacterized protein LOC129108897 [Anoplopoma fimbria]|uniref:uncharacterized protein LOC129108897 n=1 Tax=Anoplopoma fimbria TaxID=229290 RepID=UPI0023ECD833|nr:uncharacterized protein LOC129108897 [Anoplopoma fimbria]
MALQFGVSWLCSLLLWGCICFPPQKGYNFAHGYSLNDDDLSSHEGVLGPQTLNQFHSGASLNPNQDSVSPMDEMQAMRHQSFVPFQIESAPYENNEDASFVTSLGEEMEKSKPESEHDVIYSPPVSEYEHKGSGYRHPFGLLVKAHTQERTMEGTSFPTIKDFKRFIESLKRSFLIPGNDMGRHFQTAQETMENEMASNTQNVNVKGQQDTDSESYSAKEGPAHDDSSGNEVWSEAMKTAFEQGEQGAKYQMPSESLSVPDHVDASASLISNSFYDNQDYGPGPALYPRQHLAAKEHVSSNYGSFDSAGISGENPDIFPSPPDVRNEAVKSTSYKLPEQTPSGSFGDYFSFSGRVTASPVDPPNSPSQDYSDYPSKTPTSEQNVRQQSKYIFPSKDSLTGDRKLSDFELGKDFQSQELNRVPPANVLSAPMPPSLNSYGHSVYVSLPRGQLYFQDYQPKQNKRPAKSFQVYQPTVGKQSNNINYTPTAHLPLSTGSVSSSSNNPSSKSSTVPVGVQPRSPHDANLAFNRKKPGRSYTMFTVQPSSPFPGSSRHDGYLQDQTVSVSHPSPLTSQTKDEEESDLSRQNVVSATQGSRQKAENTPISSGLDSTKSGILSLVRLGDANFNSLTNLAPTSAIEKPFSRLVMSRNFGINNEISDIRGARNSLGSFSTPLRRGISLNGDYASATKPGLRQTFIKPTKLLKRPAIMNKEPGNMVYRPPKRLSASKGSAFTLSGVLRRNGGITKRLTPEKGTNISPPSVNAYVVKSRNGYVRSKVSLSKTSYAPYQLDEYKNSGSHNVKGFEQ